MNPWRGLGGLPRDMWILSGAMLVNRMGTMALPFLAIYLTESLGFSPEFAGVCLAIYGGTGLIVSPLAGRWTDRWGPRAVMTTSLLLSAVVLCLFPLASGGTSLVFATILFALTSESFRPACLAMVAMRVAPGQRKAAFALLRLAINLGMSIGPALGGFLAEVRFSAVFWVDGGTSLLAAAVLAAALGPRLSGPGDEGEPSVSGSGTPPGWRDRRLLLFLLANVPIGIVFFQHVSTMPLFMVRGLGLSEIVYGLMFTINTVLIVLIEVPLNLSTSHWPHRRTMALGCLLVAAGFGGMALAATAWGIAVTVVVWTFGEMLLLPGMTAYVSDISPPGRTGEYMGLYQTTFSFSLVVGPLVGTTLLEHLGGTTLWVTMFVLGLVSTVMLARTGSTTLAGSRVH